MCCKKNNLPLFADKLDQVITRYLLRFYFTFYKKTLEKGLIFSRVKGQLANFIKRILETEYVNKNKRLLDIS